jgi:YesN/AraC family two-component response regulator
MSLFNYIRQWFAKPDMQASLSAIRSSLNELEREAALSAYGKSLLAQALEDADRLAHIITKNKKKTGTTALRSKLFGHRSRETDNPADFPDPSATDSAAKETLLLVEENNAGLDSLRDNLSIHYAVTYVDNGKRALHLAREINPDIIITDTLTPGLSGYELCRILKLSIETSHIPVILLSALNEKENIIFGLEAGANDYILKPFDVDILKARIRNILLSREQLRKTVFSSETPIEETSYTNEMDIAFLDKAIGIVEREISNSDFSINEFCSSLAMSRTSVYNKLKSLTNQAPNDFIRIIRLNKAKELLTSTDCSVSEVSYRVGFTDPKYFSTSFKRQFGISPSKLHN